MVRLNIWPSLLSPVALQSPIEYQRRESKSNSLGRNMKCPIDLRPHSSASMDRRQPSCLLSYNTSLPSLHPPPHSLAAKSVYLSSLALKSSIIHTLLSFPKHPLSLISLHVQASNPFAATHQATQPPLLSHQQFSLCPEATRSLGTSNCLPLCNQHSMQVCQSCITRQYHIVKGWSTEINPMFVKTN